MITHEIQQTQVKTIHFFNRIKIVNSHTKSNKKHFTIHLIIFHQMMTIFMTKTILHSYHVNQPDIFEPYTREQNMRQPRPNHASQNNNFYSQNPANTDYYQPTQMQNEIPLPYYLQQHEITKY